MKGERFVTALWAGMLACLLSLGAAGCMVSAFGLTLENYGQLVLTCGFFACFSAAAFSFKWGSVPVMCVLALLSGYLWHRGQAGEQILRLLYRISHVYDQAYGCGVLKLVEGSWEEGFADIPMSMIGTAVAVTAAWTVCRRKSCVFAVSLSLLPLFSCLVVTDTVPSEGYLFLLILGLAVLLLTSRVRKQNPVQGNRLTAMAVLPAALALGVLFLAVPKESYVNRSKELQENILTWFQDIPESVENTVQNVTVTVQSHEPESVDLAGLGRRIESTAPIMEVTADVSGTLYLRGQDYDAYDGEGWTASAHRAEAFSAAGVDLGDVVIKTRREMAQLYLPYYPSNGMNLIGGKTDNTWEYTEYVIGRTGLPDNWQEAATTSGDDGDVSMLLEDAAEVESVQDRLRYRTLPNDTRARAEALLETFLVEGASNVKKAEMIAEFVRNSARYDLNTARMPAGETDFALWFLEQSETGYCVHFATAAVVLLRAAGIDARYVSGYMLDAKAGEPVTVTGKNAHAWAEYYVPALDTWVVLEATPADESAEPEAAPAASRATTPATQPNATEPSVPRTNESETSTETVPAQQQTRDFSGLEKILKLLLTVAAAMAAIALQRIIRVRLRRQRQRAGSPNARALARWQEVEQLSKLLKQPSPQELEMLAQKAKFSQHTLTAEELSRFDGYLRTARSELRKKPWYLRVIYQYVFAVY